MNAMTYTPPLTLEQLLERLARIERQEPGKLASLERVMGPLRVRESLPLYGHRAAFVNVVYFSPACKLYMPDADDEACGNCGRARSCHGR